jgi:hypothetical protein
MVGGQPERGGSIRLTRNRAKCGATLVSSACTSGGGGLNAVPATKQWGCSNAEQKDVDTFVSASAIFAALQYLSLVPLWPLLIVSR